MLDVDCRAHEVDNLYVVDTSFFPSIGAVNPALTAMANALRVGDRIARAARRRSRSGSAAMSPDAGERAAPRRRRRRRLRRRRLRAAPGASTTHVRVTLIDRNNYHQFQPLLYQVATSQLAPSDIAFSLRKLFRDAPERRRQARARWPQSTPRRGP